MAKAFLASVCALFFGWFGMIVGDELGGWPELGCLVAIIVMGAFIIYFIEKKN